MSEHRRGLSPHPRGALRAGLLLLAAAALAGIVHWTTTSEQTALRGAPGPAPGVPPLRVQPIPTLDRSEPEWRMPEEEPLLRRLRERRVLQPGSLARRDASRPEAAEAPALLPPLTAAPERAKASPAAEPLRLAWAGPPAALPAPLAAPPWDGPTTREPRVLAAELPADPSSGKPAPAPPSREAGGERLPSSPSPRPTAVEDLLVTPEGVGPVGKLGGGAPVGSNAKGVGVPLPKLGDESWEPTLTIEGGGAFPAPAVLHVPVADAGPAFAPEATPAPTSRPGTPVPGVGPPVKPSMPGMLSDVEPPVGDRGRAPLAPTASRVAVPEPGTLLLVGTGLLLLASRRPTR